jgi:hypothetical protein
MMRLRSLGILVVLAGVLSGQALVEDPVLKAQAQRGENDLPPVPRGILEPPPLPPPVTHVKDTRGWRASRTARTNRRKVVKKPKARRPALPVKKVVKKRP